MPPVPSEEITRPVIVPFGGGGEVLMMAHSHPNRLQGPREVRGWVSRAKIDTLKAMDADGLFPYKSPYVVIGCSYLAL